MIADTAVRAVGRIRDASDKERKAGMTTSTPETGFSVKPVGGALGAAIDGIDLAVPLDPAVIAALRQALLKHMVLVFPGQGHITPEHHIAFARYWRPLQEFPGGILVNDNKSLMAIVSPNENNKDADDEAVRVTRTDIWHSDSSFQVNPPLGSILLARQIPDVGGDTMFSNQYLAYDALSKTMQSVLDPLHAVHTAEGVFKASNRDPANAPRASHPIARPHPETGRKALYVNAVYTKQIEGMNKAESDSLLNYLYAHSSEPNFTYRHRWAQGDLIIWDNRCTLHYAVHDYGNAPRVMHRALAIDDSPG